MIRILFGCTLVLVVVASCSPLSKSSLTKRIGAIEETLHDHTAFVLYDMDRGKVVFDYNGSTYFTPASNTKIFTLYASLRILGDSIPALRYIERNDSLIFWGTGDPSFLYKNVYNDPAVFDFLRASDRSLFLSTANFRTTPFGPGWAWDDYNAYYSAERSAFPVYGNIFTATLAGDTPKLTPAYFNRFLSIGDQRPRNQFIRERHTNHVRFHPGERRSGTTEWDIPVRVEDSLVAVLLSDTLNKPVTLTDIAYPDSTVAVNTLHSVPSDSLYRVLMHDSDNFVAEQLLLLCAGVLSDTLDPRIAIRYVTENFLQDLPDEPRWVDGSGLSRFNLFTPRSIVKMWMKMAEIVPRERLYPLLATGGVSGTIRNWYKADQPYIFGKTGSLNNNHCLSGFLVTRSGKTLVFSFMNSNYLVPSNVVRSNMQEILQMIYERY